MIKKIYILIVCHNSDILSQYYELLKQNYEIIPYHYLIILI